MEEETQKREPATISSSSSQVVVAAEEGIRKKKKQGQEKTYSTLRLAVPSFDGLFSIETLTTSFKERK